MHHITMCAYARVFVTREVMLALENAFVGQVLRVLPHHDSVWMVVQQCEHHADNMMAT
jgi:hypothetical protein